jgi:hypothetical protein
MKLLLLLLSCAIVITSCDEIVSFIDPEAEAVYNDLPTLHKQSFFIHEDSQDGTVIDTIFTIDSIILGKLSFEIIDGNADSIFSLGKDCGVLCIANCDSLSTERQAQHSLTIEITDISKYIVSATETIYINVINTTEK